MAIVVTFEKVPIFPTRNKAHFQYALVTDGKTTYAIVNYERLDQRPVSLVGYSEPISCLGPVIKRFFRSDDTKTMLTTSNVGIPGKHIFQLSARQEDREQCINKNGKTCLTSRSFIY